MLPWVGQLERILDLSPTSLQMRNRGLKNSRGVPKAPQLWWQSQAWNPNLPIPPGPEIRVGSYAQGRLCPNSFLGKTQPWRPGRVQSMRAWPLGTHPRVLPVGAAARAAEEAESSW